MEMRALLYYRSRLDEHDRQIYDQLVNQWMRLEETVKISDTHCEISELTRAVHLDYPLMFYVNYHKIIYTKQKDGLLIEGNYLYTRDEARQLLRQCEQWGRYICENIPSGIEKKEQALWLHDVILDNTKYGHSDGRGEYNILGVVCDRVAVCGGIALAYKFLCDLADIPCIYVSGTLNDHPHGWNMVWLEGGCSFIDVTNDMNNKEGYSRKNFLRSSEEMAGYTWNTELIPECRVFNASNVFATARNKREVFQIVKKGMGRESMSIHLDFSPALTPEEVNELIYQCVSKNRSLRSREISYSPDRHVLFIQK